jgi:site-specific DNA-methyltransferase (adenine-specific)
MEAMADMPDGAYNLALVDPPYGNNDAIGIPNSKKHAATRTNYRLFHNVAPGLEYFNELKRISEQQIIWGGNFFGLEGGYLCWDKGGTVFGEAELAYCSMFNSVRIYRLRWNGMIQYDMKNKETRIHPTQKPVRLYEWLLKNYAKPGDKILDTHGGSMSIAIACDIMGFDLDLYEIDLEYFEAGKARLERHQKQGVIQF